MERLRRQSGSHKRTGEKKATCVSENFFDELHVRGFVKLLVEDDDGTTALEAVARHLHLVHRVGVEDVETARGAVGRLGGPEVEVSVLSAGLEEKDVVARREVGDLVERRERVLVLEFGICGTRSAERTNATSATRGGAHLSSSGGAG